MPFSSTSAMTASMIVASAVFRAFFTKRSAVRSNRKERNRRFFSTFPTNPISPTPFSRKKRMILFGWVGGRWETESAAPDSISLISGDSAATDTCLPRSLARETNSEDNAPEPATRPILSWESGTGSYGAEGAEFFSISTTRMATSRERNSLSGSRTTVEERTDCKKCRNSILSGFSLWTNRLST